MGKMWRAAIWLLLASVVLLWACRLPQVFSPGEAAVTGTATQAQMATAASVYPGPGEAPGESYPGPGSAYPDPLAPLPENTPPGLYPAPATQPSMEPTVTEAGASADLETPTPTATLTPSLTPDQDGTSSEGYPGPNQPTATEGSGLYPGPQVPTSTTAGGDTYPGPQLPTNTQSILGVEGTEEGPFTATPSPTGALGSTLTVTPEISPTATATLIPSPTPTVTMTPMPTATPTFTPLPPPPWVSSELQASDPAEVKLAAGKVQFIMFFAFWDGASQAMAPLVHGLEERYAEKMNFIYLDIDDPATAMLKKTLRYRNQPHFFLVDGGGSVLNQWQGYVEIQELIRAIEMAVGR